MKIKLVVFSALVFLLTTTQAQAWIVPCNPDKLAACKKACKRAGGSTVNDLYGVLLCDIPSDNRVHGSPAEKILLEEGMDVKKGMEKMPEPSKK